MNTPQRWLNIGLIGVGGVLLFLGLLPIVGKVLGVGLADSIVGELKIATDLNPWFEKALLAALGALGTAIYVKFGFSPNWNRQLVGVGAVAGLWVATYGYLAAITSDPIEGNWFTTTGEPLRCYLSEPQGVRLLYVVERDPRSGRACIPVNQDVAPKLRSWLVAQRDALARGEPALTLHPVANPKAFFGVNGEPIIWVYRHEDGRCDYFEIPGSHPIHQDELIPVTKQLRSSCEVGRLAAERRMHDERGRVAKEQAEAASRSAAEQQKVEQAQRAAAVIRADAEDRRARYQRYVGAPLDSRSVLVATAGLGDLSSAALGVLRERGHAIVLKAPFHSDGLFDAVWNGAGDLNSLGVGDAKSVVLVRPASAVRATRSAELDGLTFLRQEFVVLFMKPADPHSAQQHSFTAEGRAFSQTEADAAMRSDFVAKLRSIIEHRT